MEERCEHVKPSGERCKARAGAGSRFCYFHDPEKAAARTEARRRGARTRNRRAAVLSDADEVRIDGTADVLVLLSETASQVRRGELDHRVANCLGYLASVLLRALQQGELEERIAALEAAARGTTT